MDDAVTPNMNNGLNLGIPLKMEMTTKKGIEKENNAQVTSGAPILLSALLFKMTETADIAADNNAYQNHILASIVTNWGQIYAII